MARHDPARDDEGARHDPNDGLDDGTMDEIRRIVEAWCRKRRLRMPEVDDLVQEVALRLLLARRAGRVIHNRAGWVRRTLLSMLGDAARGRADGPFSSALEQAAGGPELDEMRPSRERPPDEEAAIRDIAESGPELIAQLPEPCRTIAMLQYPLDWTRRQIVAWLSSWSEVTADTGRKWLRRTHQMLRALGEGVDLRQRWPERYDPKRNPWLRFTPFPRPLSIDMERDIGSAIQLILNPSKCAGRTTLRGTDGSGVTKADLDAFRDAVTQCVAAHRGDDSERYEGRFECQVVNDDGSTTGYQVRLSRGGRGQSVDPRSPAKSGDDITIGIGGRGSTSEDAGDGAARNETEGGVAVGIGGRGA